MPTPDLDALRRALDKAKAADPENYETHRAGLLAAFKRQLTPAAQSSTASPELTGYAKDYADYETRYQNEMSKRTTTAPRQAATAYRVATKTHPTVTDPVRAQVEKRFGQNPHEHGRQMDLLDKTDELHGQATGLIDDLKYNAPQSMAKAAPMFRLPDADFDRQLKEDALKVAQVAGKGIGAVGGVLGGALEGIDYVMGRPIRYLATGEGDSERYLQVLNGALPNQSPIASIPDKILPEKAAKAYKAAVTGLSSKKGSAAISGAPSLQQGKRLLDAALAPIDFGRAVLGGIPSTILDMYQSKDYGGAIDRGLAGAAASMAHPTGGDFGALVGADLSNAFGFGAVRGAAGVADDALKLALKSGSEKATAEKFAAGAKKLYAAEANTAGFMPKMKALAKEHNVPFEAVQKRMGKELQHVGESGLTFGVPGKRVELIPKAAVSKAATRTGNVVRQALRRPLNPIEDAGYTELKRTATGNYQVPRELGGEHARREILSKEREGVGTAHLQNLQMTQAVMKELEEKGIQISEAEKEDVVRRFIDPEVRIRKLSKEDVQVLNPQSVPGTPEQRFAFFEEGRPVPIELANQLAKYGRKTEGSFDEMAKELDEVMDMPGDPAMTASGTAIAGASPKRMTPEEFASAKTSAPSGEAAPGKAIEPQKGSWYSIRSAPGTLKYEQLSPAQKAYADVVLRHGNRSFRVMEDARAMGFKKKAADLRGLQKQFDEKIMEPKFSKKEVAAQVAEVRAERKRFVEAAKALGLRKNDPALLRQKQAARDALEEIRFRKDELKYPTAEDQRPLIEAANRERQEILGRKAELIDPSRQYTPLELQNFPSGEAYHPTSLRYAPRKLNPESQGLFDIDKPFVKPKGYNPLRRRGEFGGASGSEKMIKDPDQLMVIHARGASKEAAKARHKTFIADSFGYKSKIPDSESLINTKGEVVHVPKQVLETLTSGFDDKFAAYSNTVMDRLMGHWKEIRLAGRAPASLRVNIQGDLFMMWLNGVRHPSNFTDAMKIWDAKHANEMFTETMTYGQAREHLMRNKVGAQSGADLIGAMPNPADLKAAQMKGAGVKFAKIKAAPGKAAGDIYKDVATLGLRRPWSKAMEGADKMEKSMIFAEHVKRRGMDPDAAIREVYRILPDYTDINKFTRGWKKVSPFGTYEAKALDIIPRSVARDPGGALMPYRFTQASDANVDQKDPARKFTQDLGLSYAVNPPVEAVGAPPQELGPRIGKTGKRSGYGMRLGYRDTAAEWLAALSALSEGDLGPLVQRLHPLGKPIYEMRSEKDILTGRRLVAPELLTAFSKNSPLARGGESALGLTPGTLQAEVDQTPWFSRWVAPMALGDDAMLLANMLNLASGNPYPVVGGARDYGPTPGTTQALQLSNILTGDRPTLTTPTGLQQDVRYSRDALRLSDFVDQLRKSEEEADRAASSGQ